MKSPDFSSLKPAGQVTTVVAAWEPAVSNDENPQRGFGGRAYLYDREMRPAKAKGTLVVYIFEEDGRMQGDERPDKMITFDAKTLNTKGIYAKSKMMGHSYNLWVPVDAAGPEGPAKKVSLIVRYIPDKGSSVVSSQATAHLPGRRSDGTMLATQPEWQMQQESGLIQQASQRSPVERPAPPQRLRAPEVRMIGQHDDRPTALQAVTIR